jgi:hypothetical protein
LAPVGDPPAREIVRRELDVDVVARGDPDAETPQAPRETCEDRVPVLELNLKCRARERLDDPADEAQRIFFDDGLEGFAPALLAAAAPFARWGNEDSFK